jgi:signal transduction histidine kinase
MQDRSTLKDSAEATEVEAQSSSGLVAHIQSATEHQKALLARELHDELGGLLVGAVMDLAWAEQHLSAPPAELKQKLVRARQTLSAAIDLKRRLIEDLRPTLLDNVGLFAALRWHVQAICKRADVPCTIRLPDDERRFLPNIPIALFRIVQETYAVIVARGHTASADFAVAINGQALTMEIETNAPASSRAAVDDLEAHALAAIAYRIAALGGSFEHNAIPTGGAILKATFPLDSILAVSQS